jgi:hypothetical protein
MDLVALASISGGEVDEEEVPRLAAGLTTDEWEHRQISGCLPGHDHGLYLPLLRKSAPYKAIG